MNVALWIVQALLACLFLFAGGIKLIMPIGEMTKQVPMPGLFLRFIAVCEALSALGLILPGLLASFVAYGRWRLAPLRESSH